MRFFFNQIKKGQDAKNILVSVTEENSDLRRARSKQTVILTKPELIKE